jgi:hypothetical protein
MASKEQKTGEAAGATIGGAAGTVIGGPIGGIIGAAAGGAIGGGVGATFEHDNDSTYEKPSPDGGQDLFDKATNQLVGHRYSDGSTVLNGQHFGAPGSTGGGWGLSTQTDLASKALANGTAPKPSADPRVGSNNTPGVTGPGGSGVGSMPGTGGLDPSAWAPTPSAGYGAPYVSPETQGFQGKLADVQKTIDDLTSQGVQRGDPRLENAYKYRYDMQRQLDASQAKDKTVDPDTAQYGTNAKTTETRAAPKINPTVIDWSSAAPLEQRQQSVGDLQQQQALALMSGASGAGEQGLIDRLNLDLEGKAPSLAEQQLLEGRDAAIANSLSIANSARGPTQGLSQLEAIRANQQLMQQTNRQQAELRAQEYAQARGELGTALTNQRGQGIQEQNVAATELGQTRTQDLQALADKYNNLVQQGQLTDADARAQLDAELRQRGMNDSQVQFWVNQYTQAKNRPQDLAIDFQKTKAGILNTQTGLGIQQQQVTNQQDQYDTGRTDKYIAAGLNAAATAGSTYLSSQKGTGVQSSPGASTPPTAPTPSTTTTTPQDTGYGSDDIKNPWADEEAA